MKVSFWLTSTTRVMTMNNWGIAPMGGAEISAVQLGEELLKLDYDVTYYLQRCEPFDKGNLHVRLHRQVAEEPQEIFVCVRPHAILTNDFGEGIKKVLWSGDAFDQTSNNIFFNQPTAKSMTAYVFKSNWQKEKMLERFFYIPPEKVKVIYNGVKREFFGINGIVPNPKRFIHTSTFYRGVHNFLDIWPMILDEIPDAEIHVFSKTSLYMGNMDDGKQKAYAELAEKLVHLPNFVLREPIPQYRVAEEMAKAWLMLYPNSGFVESSCGSVQQSIAVGTPVIATKRAGLPETIRENGVLIEQNGEGWKEDFAKATIELSKTHPEKREEMAKYGRLRGVQESWEVKAKEWDDFLRSL